MVTSAAQITHGTHEAGTEMSCLCFSRDDHTLLSRGCDGTLKVRAPCWPGKQTRLRKADARQAPASQVGSHAAIWHPHFPSHCFCLFAQPRPDLRSHCCGAPKAYHHLCSGGKLACRCGMCASSNSRWRSRAIYPPCLPPRSAPSARTRSSCSQVCPCYSQGPEGGCCSLARLVNSYFGARLAPVHGKFDRTEALDAPSLPCAC